MAGIAKRDERGRTVDVHALRHTFGTLLSKGAVSPITTAQAAMRHSTINTYVDPKLLDVHGSLDALPTRDLNSSPQTEAKSMRATGINCRDVGVASDHAQSFVAPTSGKPGLFESFPVTLGSLCDGEIQATERLSMSSNIKKKPHSLQKRMRLQRGG